MLPFYLFFVIPTNPFVLLTVQRYDCLRTQARKTLRKGKKGGFR